MMTPEQLAEGLAQVQQLLLGLASSQSRTADQIESLNGAIDVLRQSSQQQAVAVDRLIDAQMQTFDRIDEMQSEVRGLQTENRRIWERLEGLSSDDGDH
jgi:chromosome segregation ATPase